jgi:hypothetical protein
MQKGPVSGIPSAWEKDRLAALDPASLANKRWCVISPYQSGPIPGLPRQSS